MAAATPRSGARRPRRAQLDDHANADANAHRHAVARGYPDGPADLDAHEHADASGNANRDADGDIRVIWMVVAPLGAYASEAPSGAGSAPFIVGRLPPICPRPRVSSGSRKTRRAG